MSADPHDPAQRLALSRERLRRALHGGGDGPTVADPPSGDDPDHADEHADASLALAALRVWWAKHPWRATAVLASDMLTLLLAPQARRHPLRLIAVAGGTGALLAVARPWRALGRPGWLALWPMLQVAVKAAMAPPDRQ